MNVNEYIEHFLIKEIGELVGSYPFQAFTLMAIGIEFLGKCLDESKWDNRNKSSNDFKTAIEKLDSLVKYKNIDNLYDKLRCGLAHLGIPKIGIALSSDKNYLDANPIILGCKDFYDDFKLACVEIINDSKSQVKKKMDEDYVSISESVTSSTVSNQ